MAIIWTWISICCSNRIYLFIHMIKVMPLQSNEKGKQKFSHRPIFLFFHYGCCCYISHYESQHFWNIKLNSSHLTNIEHSNNLYWNGIIITYSLIFHYNFPMSSHKLINISIVNTVFDIYSPNTWLVYHCNGKI